MCTQIITYCQYLMYSCCRMENCSCFIRESVDSLCRDGSGPAIPTSLYIFGKCFSYFIGYINQSTLQYGQVVANLALCQKISSAHGSNYMTSFVACRCLLHEFHNAYTFYINYHLTLPHRTVGCLQQNQPNHYL